MCKISISSLTKEKLGDYVKQQGLPAFRAKQIFSWLHQKNAKSFEEMTNLPKNLITALNESCYIDKLEIAKKQVSKDGTIKYLFRLSDSNCIESVIMRYEYGVTICVSTQVGCRMGCRFCASTQAGLCRNLTAGEIAAEVYAARADIGERISHIVLMGIGEPLDNYDNVMDFLDIISDDDGINIGMRNITLSTCGIVPKIDRLAQRRLGITLSLSLHAPNDELRSRMMPVNNKYKVAQVIEACKNYQQYTGRRVSFEYSMVKGVNDTDECARQLAGLVRSMGAHINLIPINPVDGSPFTATDADNVKRFKQRLEELGLNATIRRRLGTDISAACGQLRREESGNNKLK